MKYYSLNRSCPESNFENAVRKGLAPDRGLYYPKTINKLSNTFFNEIENLSNLEIAYRGIEQFVGLEIPKHELKSIIEETINFDFPLERIENSISTLELFHGPTMAFKDVGARFMARCLRYFNKKQKNEITVLVATSGDTGGAVANGFYGVEGIKVVILYPKGKVSQVQEKQLTTLGKNITAFEVNGTFDDCQDMVKRAFLDNEISSTKELTSANSINIARWLPQMFYFMFAYKKLKQINKQIVFSVPSGNFGNICAGMIAQQLGFPFKKFIASNNANDVVIRYLNSNSYNPKPTIQTISNAMDVGNPSNFTRIMEIYENDYNKIKSNLCGYSFLDNQTKNAITDVYKNTGYVMDPHAAIGYLGCKEYLKTDSSVHTVFLETAHYTKFLDTVEPLIKKKIELPMQIKSVVKKNKVAFPIENYNDFKENLMTL
jgi:threonine synthase